MKKSFYATLEFVFFNIIFTITYSLFCRDAVCSSVCLAGVEIVPTVYTLRHVSSLAIWATASSFKINLWQYQKAILWFLKSSWKRNFAMHGWKPRNCVRSFVKADQKNKLSLLLVVHKLGYGVTYVHTLCRFTHHGNDCKKQQQMFC